MPSTIPTNTATDNSFHGSPNLESTVPIGNIIRGDMSSNYAVSFMSHSHNSTGQDIPRSIGENFSSRGDVIFEMSHSTDSMHRQSVKRKLDSHEES